MKQFSEQLKKKADSIRLKAAERNDLRDRLVAYMEYHPLPTSVASAPKRILAKEELVSEAFSIVSFKIFNTLYVRSAVGAFAVVLLAVVPLVAERSVPGDTLYPIKVSFNEELRSTFTGSGYEKVEWETERLSRRIAEARLLASEGKLTPEFAAEVAEAVKEHSDAAQAEIDNIRVTNADEAAIAEIVLASALDVQTAVLAADEERASTTPNGAGIVVAVATAKESATEDASLIQPSYAGLRARLELQTTRASELFESVSDYAVDSEITDIERRLQDIDRKIVHAIDLAAATSTEPAAVGLLREALTSTQKLIAFMTDIDVRETVAIDTLIPTELTADERQAAVADVLAKTKTFQSTLETALTDETPDAVAEKIAFGLTQIETALATIETLDEEADLTTIEQLAADAHALARDLALSVGQSTRPTTTAPISVDDASTTASTTDDGTEDAVEDTEIDENLTDETDETSSTTDATTTPEDLL